MPPYRQAQNASMNCSLLATCRISDVAGLGADALQVVQDAERAAAQLGERQGLLGSLALEVADRALAAAAVVEHFRERLVLDHRSLARILAGRADQIRHRQCGWRCTRLDCVRCPTVTVRSGALLPADAARAPRSRCCSRSCRMRGGSSWSGGMPAARSEPAGRRVAARGSAAVAGRRPGPVAVVVSPGRKPVFNGGPWFSVSHAASRVAVASAIAVTSGSTSRIATRTPIRGALIAGLPPKRRSRLRARARVPRARCGSTSICDGAAAGDRVLHLRGIALAPDCVACLATLQPVARWRWGEGMRIADVEAQCSWPCFDGEPLTVDVATSPPAAARAACCSSCSSLRHFGLQRGSDAAAMPRGIFTGSP